MPFKFNRKTLIEHPIHTSVFVMLFLLLMFLPLIRPPVVLCLFLLCGLVYVAMYFGAKMAVDSASSET